MRVGVIGGGVIGLACAHELVRGGADVVVFEAAAPGSGASHGNTGWVTPSFTFPLPAPGVVSTGLKWLVHPSTSPLRLLPTTDPTALRWLWEFRRNCSSERFRAGVRAFMALHERTFEVLDRWAGDDGLEFEMHALGLLCAARTRAGLGMFKDAFDTLGELGYTGGIEELDRERMLDLEPALAPDYVAAGLHALIDRHVHPAQLCAGLAAGLAIRGADVRTASPVVAIDRLPRGLALRTLDDSVAVDAAVVCAALGSSTLLERHGLSIPLAGGRGYSLTARGSGVAPRHALYLAEAKTGISAFRDGVRIAGVFEVPAAAAVVDRRRVRSMVDQTCAYLRDWRPTPDEPKIAWAGLRPMSPDGLPYIGAVPGASNLYVATGHGMLGVTLAPATAAALAPQALGGAPDPVLAPFAPDRRR